MASIGRWPLSLSYQTLSRLLADLGLGLGPFSPVAGRISVAAPSSERVEAVAADERVVTALGVVADPRRMLLLAQFDASHGEARVFLQRRSGTVVRFDLREHGCLISAPSGREEFVQAVGELLAPPEDAPDGEPFVITRRLLAAAAALRDAAPPGTNSLARSRALEAFGRVTSDGADRAAVLQALDDGGVIAAGTDRIELNPRWYERHGYFFQPARTLLYSIEFADLGRGFLPRRLAILGSDANRRLGLLPLEDGPRLDQRWIFRPLDRTGLIAAVQELASDPGGPPGVPRRLATAIAPLSQTGGLEGPVEEPWTLSPLSELAIEAQAGRVPELLLRPMATLTARCRRQGVDLDRPAIALGENEAVEWELRGSMVRWRLLGRQALSARVRALLPEIGPNGVASPVEVRTAALRVLLESRPTAAAIEQLPPLLRPIADPDTLWCTLRALAKTADGISGTELIFASLDGRAWRFEPSGTGMLATSTSAGELFSELARALGPVQGSAT